MHITPSTLAKLRRPRLLISAARFGIAQYDRETFLGKIFGEDVPAPGNPCLANLLEYEAEINRTRRSQTGDYRIAEHIEVLAAIMAESRTLRERESARISPNGPGGVAPYRSVASG